MEGDRVHLHPSRESLHGGNSAVVFENFAGGEELGTLEMSFVQAIVKPEIDGDEDELDMSLTRPAAKKRRLTSNQLQLLEDNFAVENRLEPERKLQLAKELGMQPRQVAIWFQNRRARFKNKQLEKEYDSLKGSFEKLKAEFECLVKEKESLEYEVASLKGKLDDDRENGIVPLESHYADQSTRAGDGEKACNLPVVISPTPKHEEASSAKSDVFDSDSPLSFLGQDQSDHFSQDEGDHHLSCFLSSSLPRICQDPSPDSCNYGFPVEDHPFWTTYGGMY